MHPAADHVFRNALLRRLPAADLALLTPHLHPVTLEKRRLLVEAMKPIERAYFLEQGIASVIASTAEGRQAEVGIVGYEGMVDTATALGSEIAALDIVMQVDGRGHVMPASALRHAALQSPAIAHVLQSFALAQSAQLAHGALAAATMALKARLARWLLMSADRTDGPRIAITHEYLALMLSVRRPGVTEAVAALERAGAITARRGTLEVCDRQVLVKIAADGYGTPEAIYARLLTG